MEQKKKLFLLDSYALIFRAYYAFIKNPMRNAKGMNTSTVFGFTLTLDEIIRKEQPTHILAAFDPGGPTFRHEMFPAYKANRDATPEDIKEAVPWVKKTLEGFNIPIVEVPGYEADDVIGTLAKRAEKQGYEVYMVTPDKDYAQLVSENIYMYKPGRSGNPAEILGVPEVREKFNIQDPIQVIDILALMGDSSDNIPGAYKVGEKTASTLIEKFGSVEAVYENLDQLKGKQKENVENSKDNVFLSKTLATISLDVPVDLDFNATILEDVDKDKLNIIFDELNFKNLKTRILGVSDSASIPVSSGGQTSLFGDDENLQPEAAPDYKTIDSVEHEYQLVSTKEGLKTLLADLALKEAYCFDTETTGLDVIAAELVGISFSCEAHKAWYANMPAEKEEFDQWITLLKEFFSRENVRIIGQNLKYDLHILKNYDITAKGTLFDTMVAHYLLYPNRKHGIDAMAEDFLSYSKIKTEELIGKKNTQQISFNVVDTEKVKDYACEDADITWQMYELLAKELKEKQLVDLAQNIEMPLVQVLMKMEHAGVKINSKVLSEFASSLREELIKLEKEIYDLAGQAFNISSPKQLGVILFEKLKVSADIKKTRTKQYSTSEEVLVRLLDSHDIVGKVLEYRSVKKLLSTYVEALPRLVHEKTGRIHTSFNQTLVATGRLSSNNPNLQNIPIRDEKGREIRKAFISNGKDYYFLSADYSQIELRLMAHLSKDENMIRAFQHNEDIHTSTAAKVYSVDIKDVTKEMRSKAKTANFGIIYGISAFGLSQRMRIPRTEAKELIDGYFKTYPGVKAFMDASIEKAREKGYAETMFGRKQLLPDILSRNSNVRGIAERNAINTPLQGSAADIIKIAMININNAFIEKGLKSSMIIQVHDELNFDVPLEELELVSEIVRKEMENAVNLSVPLLVDMNHGLNWLEAH